MPGAANNENGCKRAQPPALSSFLHDVRTVYVHCIPVDLRGAVAGDIQVTIVVNVIKSIQVRACMDGHPCAFRSIFWLASTCWASQKMMGGTTACRPHTAAARAQRMRA